MGRQQGKPPGVGKATQFKPGNKANPKGAGAHDPEVKKIRRLTREQVVEVGSLVLEKNQVELKKIWKSKREPSLKCWFAGVAYMAIVTGNSTHYNALLDRVIGKVKDEIKFEGNLQVREKYKRMTDKELAEELATRSSKLARITRGK